MVCPVCSASSPETVFYLEDVPAHVAVVYPTPESARTVARGDIHLVLCPSCGHVWNASYDPALTDYSETYDASLHHSATYRVFLEETADALARRHRLTGRTVVGVGCGEGTFLRLLARRTGAHPIGIDPSAPEDGLRVRYWSEPFSDTHANALRTHDVALLTCRQMLHYIVEPAPFVERIASIGAPLYVEVPNGAWVFEAAVPWTVFYEHVAYFSPASLGRLLGRAGLGTEMQPTYDGGQYLAAYTTDTLPEADAPDEAYLANVCHFGERAREAVSRWRETLSAASARGETIVVWGAAGRGTTFVGAMPEGSVAAVADNNPARQGSFVAGTGTPILAPEELPALNPDRIVLTNRTYEAEIRAQLARLDVAAEVEIA